MEVLKAKGLEIFGEGQEWTLNPDFNSKINELIQPEKYTIKRHSKGESIFYLFSNVESFF